MALSYSLSWRKIIFTLCVLFCGISQVGYAQNTTVKKGLKVLYIGDSVTDGNWGGGGCKKSSDRNHWDQNHIFGHGYMFLCAAYYTSNYPERNYEFYNRGISGNTLNDLDNRWKEDVLDINPDVLSILVGINDVSAKIRSGSGQFDLNEWDEKYRNLLKQALAKNPHLKLVLCAPFVLETEKMKKEKTWNKYDQLTHECAAVIYKIAADYNVVYLPFNVLYDNLKAKYPEVPTSYWLWDGVHPTAAAHQLMADMWIEEAAEYMK